MEEFWAYWSRYIYVNRYDQPAGKPYEDLLSLVKEKDCFVLTTNVDHRFQTAGFDKERLFYTVREKYEPRLWRNLFGIFLLIFLAIRGYCFVIFTKI